MTSQDDTRQMPRADLCRDIANCRKSVSGFESIGDVAKRLVTRAQKAQEQTEPK